MKNLQQAIDKRTTAITSLMRDSETLEKEIAKLVNKNEKMKFEIRKLYAERGKLLDAQKLLED